MSSFTNDVTGDAVLAFVSMVLDSTGRFAFCPESLPAKYTYDGNNRIATETRGPDAHGNFFRLTYTFVGGNLDSQTGWEKV